MKQNHFKKEKAWQERALGEISPRFPSGVELQGNVKASDERGALV